ncbi:Uncharacterised protein [Mycobacteroides abscessus subsp. abscessus]|nr:Uncharacterised protein [Mycobacteroides abscessus subsp. abscessus]
MCGLIPALLRSLLPAGPVGAVVADRWCLCVVDRYRAVLIHRRLINTALIVGHLWSTLAGRLKHLPAPRRTVTATRTTTIWRARRPCHRHCPWSEPTQAESACREQQHRDDSGCRSSFLGGGGGPLVQASQTFPPTQIRADCYQQHDGDCGRGGQNLRAGDPHVQPGRDPCSEQHQAEPATDECGDQPRMPERLVPLLRLIAVCFGIIDASHHFPHQTEQVLAAREQCGTGKNRHEHLTHTEGQRPASLTGDLLPPRAIATPEAPPHPQRPSDHRQGGKD